MKLSELLERLNNLKQIPRTGWLLCNVPLTEVEDVAQHTFDVVIVTFLLADELERKGKKLNRERALGMAIVHDWAEVSIGDFPYTAKKHLGPASIKKNIEENALKEILHGFPENEKYIQLWREYTEKQTLESKIVHIADYISMLVQAIKYKERGHSSKQLFELWTAVEKDIQPYLQEFPWIKPVVMELRKSFQT